MSRYIPQPAYIDRMPVDISFVFEDEKPAGKHGFLKVDGKDFKFEDGTKAKFWGTNVSAGALFLSKEKTDALVCLTGMDEENIVLSLLAKQLNVKKVICLVQKFICHRNISTTTHLCRTLVTCKLKNG